MHSQITHKIYQYENKIYMSCKWKQLVAKKNSISVEASFFWMNILRHLILITPMILSSQLEFVAFLIPH